MNARRLVWSLAAACLALGCGTAESPPPDAGSPDLGASDVGGLDAGGLDMGGRDVGTCDPVTGCTTDRICGSSTDCADADPCTTNETCNPVTATCTYTLLDNDQDGEVPLVCGGTDCDDSTDEVGAGAAEICGNDRDDNCNGVTDMDATLQSSPLVLLNSEAHCGSCGNACEAGQTCYLGTCVACGATTGATCCDTTCTSPTSCSGGSCTNGGACEVTGATATCSAPCGGSAQVCCGGGQCNAGLMCSAGTCIGNATCGDAGPPVLYRVSRLDIPTLTQAGNGEVVGHNVDNLGDVCGVPDWAGGVDNAFVEVAPALSGVGSGALDFQAEIDHALACPPNTPSCRRMDIVLRVAVGTQCAWVEVLDGFGNDAQTLAGPVRANLDASGNLSADLTSLALIIPLRADGSTVMGHFHLAMSRLTGVVSANAVSNVVLSGVMEKTGLETTLMNLAPLYGGDVPYADIAPILSASYDVQFRGMCVLLSVGFLGHADAAL